MVPDHFRNIALVFAITSLYGLVAYMLAADSVTYRIQTVGLDATTAILSNVAGGCALVLLLPFVVSSGLLYLGGKLFAVHRLRWVRRFERAGFHDSRRRNSGYGHLGPLPVAPP